MGYGQRSHPEPPRLSAAMQEFVDSLNINYERWHDGVGYAINPDLLGRRGIGACRRLADSESLGHLSRSADRRRSVLDCRRPTRRNPNRRPHRRPLELGEGRIELLRVFVPSWFSPSSRSSNGTIDSSSV